MNRNRDDIADLLADDDDFEDVSYRERIVQDPAVMVGKPVIRGTRIPVEVVLGKFTVDLDPGELFAAYPELTIENVKASLAFARESILEDYRRSRREAARHAIAGA